MAANTNQVSLTQLVNPLDPNSIATAYQVQRQQAYAKALQDQAFQPMDQGKMVGDRFVAPPKSAHIAKIVQMLLSGYINKTADENAAEQVKANTEAMSRAVDPNGPTQAVAPDQAASAALSMGAASGTPQPVTAIDPVAATPPTQPGQIGAPTNRTGPTPQTAALMDNMTAPQPGSTGSPLNPLKMNKELAVQLLRMDPAKYLETQAGAYKQADIVGKLRAAGIDPNSQQGRQFALENVQKENYIAPINAREGSTILDPVTRKPVFNAPNKDGIQYTFDQNGVPTAKQIPGFTDAVSAFEAARRRGQNMQTLAPKEILPTLPNGQVQPRTIEQTINPPNAGFPAPVRVPGSGQSAQSERASVMQEDLARIQARPDSDPRKAGDLAAIQREIAAVGGLPASAQAGGLGPAFGQEQGAKLAQEELSKKWTAQQQAHQGAETSSSYLQNISKLADKAATGRFSDALDLKNSILSSLGSQKATDAVSANNLMKKYQSQIIQQLGGGSAGTDAFRAIIGEGTPGAQMNVPAIKEAVSNLIGKNDMVKARTNVLGSLANARDPAAYSQKEMIFDQNADPRIWQYKNLGPGTAQGKAFAASVMKSDPNFAKKIQALEKIGAL